MIKQNSEYSDSSIIYLSILKELVHNAHCDILTFIIVFHF